ncbi:hypothetical protein PAECIP111893_02905 [Paenibacillus plantiphilus]|uniref:YvaD family protein n=1 Tax=Paenibacillus plantiphilus TaxID=2905650 RepID=A0ABN8GGX4_9BACL|nr:DUF5360 family protein [Paenibacillus plantiphilus]CAH1208807.1 hypothetical protein PAECIP111893_02905 [Paenibacillus plantiphilus]
MSRTLRWFMIITDIGFVGYWLVTFLELLPKDYLYRDYDNELLVSWNLSFVPLDLLISFTGLLSIYFYRRQFRSWSIFAIISLVLTFCSGLQAIAFWGIRLDFDVWWWTPNLFLLLYPLFFLRRLMRDSLGPVYSKVEG